MATTAAKQSGGGAGAVLLRHIMGRHEPMPGARPQDVLTCIDNVMSNGEDVGNGSKPTTRLGWRYGTGWAYVIIDTAGLVRTAYTSADGSRIGNDWISCAEG